MVTGQKRGLQREGKRLKINYVKLKINCQKLKISGQKMKISSGKLKNKLSKIVNESVKYKVVEENERNSYCCALQRLIPAENCEWPGVF
jgi:hypothetical protein